MTGVADALRAGVGAAMDVLDVPVLVYFALVNTSYLILVVVAALELAGHLRRTPFDGRDEAYASPMTPGVSLVVAAYNEEAGIIESVRAMLALRHPEFEIVVVDDGSTDGTYERLQAAYDLVEVPRVVPDDVPTRGRVLSVSVPADGRTPLVVVRKENGGRSDASNVGINVARMPLVSMVDADSLLDPDALLNVARPFAEDPLRVVASGGVIRAANGSRVVAGRVVEARMPKQWLARIQVVEYLRAFFLGRAGWSRLQCLVLISGAFGLYRRDVLVELGGLDADCIGEDFELIVRIHRTFREQRRDYRVVFVAEPISWTEVPTTRAVLARQRRRWHRGLWEVLFKHRRMLGNPRYGRIGLVALPYYVLFELLAPVIEIAGTVLVVSGLALGAVDLSSAWRFLLVAYGYALFVSLAAVAVEEFSFHRYGRWRDLTTTVLASVLENVGYRQLTAWWRLQGLWSALRGGEQVWGVMTRQGFGDPRSATPTPQPALVPAVPTPLEKK